MSDSIEQTAIENYHGDIKPLESAIGMLKIGYRFGWRFLFLIHSKVTVKKYADILKINVRKEFPEYGPSAPRSIGLRIVATRSNFWKSVSGEHVKIENKDIIEALDSIDTT